MSLHVSLPPEISCKGKAPYARHPALLSTPPPRRQAHAITLPELPRDRRRRVVRHRGAPLDAPAAALQRLRDIDDRCIRRPARAAVRHRLHARRLELLFQADPVHPPLPLERVPSLERVSPPDWVEL